MLRSWWRQALVVVLFLLIASCSGGGCASGCSSCGIQPLAGGFDPAKTIPNSASVRLTQSGLAFLSNNLPNLISGVLGRGSSSTISFDVPQSSGSTGSCPFSGIGTASFSICSTGVNATSNPPLCVAQIDLGACTSSNANCPSLTLGSVTPNNVTVTGTIPVVLRDLPIDLTISPLCVGNIDLGRMDVAMGTNLTCLDPGSTAQFLNVPITISLPLVAETIAPRAGYTKVDAANAVINIGLQQSDIQLCANCPSGAEETICQDVLNLVTSTVFSTLQSEIGSVVQNELATQLCTKANSALSPACPIGSHPDTANDAAPPLLSDGGDPVEPNCNYDSAPSTCVPIELGLEGNINLGALLQSISPGTTGALDFALAANGNMNPANSGVTLGMLGGGIPAPQSECVPLAANPAPTHLVVPSQMLTNTVTGYGADAGPDIGVALDGQFLNYFLGSAYNSGLLCLGVTTEKYQELNTGLVSFLIPSIKTLTFEQKAAAIAITTRPQNPPALTLGGGTSITTDPLLSIGLKAFALDFYVWSEDRYVRALTYTADLTIPMNIQSSAAGIVPVLGTLVIANGVVTNNVLITDSPTVIASALSGVLGSIVGQLLGSGIPPISLASALSSLGLTFDIPPGGIQTITQAGASEDGGTESYLGLFGNLGVASGALPHIVQQIDTTASFVGKTVHPEAMAIDTFNPALAPSLHVAFGSSAGAGANVEYSWQIDQGTFSAWAPDTDVVIHDPMLWMQAKHTLNVVARIAGVPASQDPSPAAVPFAIDVLPPSVEVQQQDTGWALIASDIVSPVSALVARTRGTDASGKTSEWTAWQPVAQVSIAKGLTNFEAQVRDEEGNVGSVSSALIRGGPDPTLPPTGGCTSGCTTGSSSSSGWPAIALGIAGLAALFARRRRHVRAEGVAWSTLGPHRAGSAFFALGSIVAVAATSQGCSCGSSSGAQGGGGEIEDASFAEGGGGEGGGQGGQPLCGQGCSQACNPGLPQGLIGAYTSIAQAADGTIWVAGYNDSAVDPSNGVDAVYGDLVAGKYDTSSSSVKWVTVDGLPPPLPAGTCPPNDPTGWRGGVVDSGPDVGLWTSMVLDASGHPMVSYYDATNQQVKFASSSDGVTWATHVIYSHTGSDAGRYSKIAVIDGNPVVAYLVVETGTNGYSRTRVSLAHASKALPAASSDWAVEDALVDETSPCRAVDCAAGQACDLTTMVCTTVSDDCDAACATGEACIDVSGVGTCTKVAQSTDVHPYPQAVGDYINMSAITGGIGLVVYDRIHGNLLGLTNATGTWAVTILDGETGSRAAGTAVDTGDDGVGASLFVAANGDWHVSYVDGISETLKYLYVPGGTLVSTLVPQIVDTGYTVDGAPFSDGLHIIGDDSNVRQNADGSITITYMDATSGALRLATGTTGTTDDAGTWTLHAISQPNEFAGFFPHFVPNSTQIANWWRWAVQSTQVISGNVAIVTP